MWCPPPYTSQTFSHTLKQFQLGGRFFREVAQIGKTFVRGAENFVRAAFGIKKAHYFFVVRACNFVSFSEFRPVLCGKSRKMCVQRIVKIFAVSVSQRKPDSKADNSAHACLNTAFHKERKIFHRVVYVRQKRVKPHNRRNSTVAQNVQHFNTPACCADIRFDYAA